MYQLEPIKKTDESIASIENLCNTLDISLKEINEALSLSPDERYVYRKIPKSDGSYREVYNPHNLIRKIQRRINRRIFIKLVKWPSYIFGSIPNNVDSVGQVLEAKDYVSCAFQHCQSKSLLKMDLKDFFNNVHIDHVHDIFEGFFNYPSEVSRVLSDLCCREDSLVQGALTSSYIASLCLWRFEPLLVKRLKRKNLVYTRLVDDITVSSKISNFQFDMTIEHIKNMLYEMDLPLNNEKTKVIYTSIEPLTVHGMRVNFKEPRYSSDEVRKLRSAVHNIECLASEPGYRVIFAYRRDFNRCMGRINKLKRVGHEKHKTLVSKLLKILPLPSEKDLKRCKASILRLEADYPLKGDSYWYRKRFYILHDRLNVLQRTYNKTADSIRDRMKEITPKYDD